jgi:hypothetical protein
MQANSISRTPEFYHGMAKKLNSDKKLSNFLTKCEPRDHHYHKFETTNSKGRAEEEESSSPLRSRGAMECDEMEAVAEAIDYAALESFRTLTTNSQGCVARVGECV